MAAADPGATGVENMMQKARTDEREHGARVTRTTGIVALAIAALLLASPALAGADDPEPVSGIEITQVDSSTQNQCLPGPLVLSYRKSNTSDFFELVVKASAPPCDLINAKAVRYAMPGNGEAWPQTLVEVVPFTISRAGTTTIRFTKTCDPMQFDVLTGATPEEIAPWGEWHGPLLFPFDPDTALQHWGWDCDEPGDETTTTTEPVDDTTTTEPVDDTTTTTEPVDDTTTTTEPGDETTTTTEPVDDTTTTTEPSVEETTTVPTEVGGITEERDPGDPGDPGTVGDTTVETDVAGVTDQQGGSDLAYTGSNTNGPVAAGLALAMLGMVLMVVSRRRGALNN